MQSGKKKKRIACTDQEKTSNNNKTTIREAIGVWWGEEETIKEKFWAIVLAILRGRVQAGGAMI